MSYEFELNHKKTTTLVGVFFALLILVFVAGWLSGALFGLPVAGIEPAPVAMPDVPPREQPAVMPIKIVPPPAEPAPAPEPRFSVQVGAFQTAAKARNQALDLREKGYAPYVLRGLNSRGATWFTVRIGDYVDYDKAVVSALAFETTEGVAPVITHIDTLSVVRTADGSLPSTVSLDPGQRLGIDDLADESAGPTAPETGDASPVEEDPAVSENRRNGSDGNADDVTEPVTPETESADATEENLVAAERTADESADAPVEEVSTDEAAGTDDVEKTVGNHPAALDADSGQAESDETASEPRGDDANRFSVQVGAFLNARNAHNLADKLRAKGYGAYVFDVDDAAGKTWYAVRIDDYLDMKAALAAARKVREKEELPALVTRIDSLTVVAVPVGGLAEAGPHRVLPVDRPVYPVSDGTARHPHSLRLASFRSQEATDQAVVRYRQKGLPAFSMLVRGTDRDTFGLIHMGLYDSYASADRAKAELNLAEAVVKKTPWANLVGVYASMVEAEAQADRLVEAGFSPYLVKPPDDTVRVLAGAFSSHEGAEAQGERLAQSGFHSAVVER